MASPLPLVKCDPETGKFAVGEEAIDVLRNFTHPLAIVAVCGKPRQGKSSLLNWIQGRLLGRSADGFKATQTTTTCTKGLWMSSPILKTTSDGRKYGLVLLDTEGIDATDQPSQKYGTQIFTLAVLLSSFLVYNQMGIVDEPSIVHLALVTKLTKNIQYSENMAGSTNNIEDRAPSFLWLFRDAYLDLPFGDDGKQITLEEYMENILSARNCAGDRKDMRESIKLVFPDRSCMSFSRPVDDSELPSCHTSPLERLRSQFREGVEALTNLISEKAKPKHVGGQEVTGPTFGGLVESYVKFLNEGLVPNIQSAWQGVVAFENKQACDAAVRAYKENFNTNVSWDENALEAENERCLDLAKSVFDSRAVGVGSVRQECENKFHNEIGTFFKLFKAEAFKKKAEQDLEEERERIEQLERETAALRSEQEKARIEKELREQREIADRKMILLQNAMNLLMVFSSAMSAYGRGSSRYYD